MRNFLILLVAAGSLWACSSQPSKSVRCVLDTDCPAGQQCVAGDCQLPADPGTKLCSTISDCPAGYFCDQGFCKPIPEEPPKDACCGPDGGDLEDQTAVEESPSDEDRRDFSAYVFMLAAGTGLPTTQAVQCLYELRPPANSGPVLGEVKLKPALRLSGLVNNQGAALAQAEVSLVGDSRCLPAPTKTDGQGAFTFQLSPGNYRLRVKAYDGRYAYDQIDLQAPATRSIAFPATAQLAGGPLEYEGGQAANGWALSAYFASGIFMGEIAQSGAISGPPNQAGCFSLTVSAGAYYDIYGDPPVGGNYPRQVIYQAVQPGTALHDRTLKSGVLLSGAVSAGGPGLAGATVSLREKSDGALSMQTVTATGGVYRLMLENARTWRIEVLPTETAFQQGALLYVNPEKFITADTSLDIELGTGRREVFRGRLLDSNNVALSGVTVKLYFQGEFNHEGLYPLCHPQGATTGRSGEFEIECNLP